MSESHKKHTNLIVKPLQSTIDSLDIALERAEDELQLQMLLIEVASSNPQANFILIEQAYEYANKKHAGQNRKSGHPFLQHCVEVARILAQLRLDTTTVAAGLLHDVIEDTETTYQDIVTHFGDKIADLIDGVTKIDQITYESREERQAETYRKMLLSMVKDIRVILIKLVDRLHNMRTLQYIDTDAQQRIAHETLDVYAPLAHRFGLARIRWELEDRSLKYIQPKIYNELRQQIAMKRLEREDYIDQFKKAIEDELSQSSIDTEISGRPKNFFSIYNKMCARQKPFEEIYDLFAIRIVVGSIRECYQTLGLVHSIYAPIPERIKDYISTPKSNMYQSLHTSVIGPRGLPVEVQIRTREMHHTAEIGIAAHWRYKSGEELADLEIQKNWLQNIIDLQREAEDPNEFLENFKIELFSDEIFVFTPKGDLLQLPKGATPIDFAFNVHTDIGLHCLTAKANGQVIPLNSALKSGDTIEIITSDEQSPKHIWLESVQTIKARQAIRRWIKDEKHSHSVRFGKELLERELKRYINVISHQKLNDIAITIGLDDVEQLYASLGNGDMSIKNIIGKFVPKTSENDTLRKHNQQGIKLHGSEASMISLGYCCRPIPGDIIVGLIMDGKEVAVHRADCSRIGELIRIPERILQVSWDKEHQLSYTVQLQIRSRDRTFLLSDICSAIGQSDCNIRSTTTRTIGNSAEQIMWIDVRDIAHLHNAINNASKVEGVWEVARIDEKTPESQKFTEIGT